MLTVIGAVPSASEAEAAQFERVIPILRNAQDRIGPWCYLILDHGFSHRRGTIIELDHDWNGQIDMILIAPHKIAIYELKGFTASIVSGTTGPKPWRIRRSSSGGHEENVRSYFMQASEQRAFLLSDFLHKFGRRHPEYAHNHWVVDSRVVFKGGSDLSGFFYSVPATDSTENLESNVFASLANEDDKAFVDAAYSDTERGTGKRQLVRLEAPDWERLQRIYRENRIEPRTTKWFRVITEDQITDDLDNIGSDRFSIDQECASAMIEDLRSTAWEYGFTGPGPARP